VISAASADVIASASPRGYHEVRQGLTAAAAWRPTDAATFSLRYLPSWEPDYESHTIAGSIDHELEDRRLTIHLGARLSYDSVGRVGSARDSWRPLTSGDLDLSASWVFGPRTVGQLAYELVAQSGAMASPYRFVRLGVPGAGFVGVPEAVPGDRSRHALSASVRHAIARAWFASISYRFYADSWGVTSHTEELGFEHVLLRGKLTLGTDLRLYGQSAASFYQERYGAMNGALPALRTADKMLAPSLSWLCALRASWALGPWRALEALRLTAKLELYEQRFQHFAPLAARTSIIASLGVAGEFWP
jgi:hypothetical protein